MIADLLQTRVLFSLEKALDGTSARHQAIVNNMANYETPGFKRSVVQFETALQAAMNGEQKLPLATTHPRHFSSQPSLPEIQPQILQDTQTSLRNDGNNVDIDAENGELVKNFLTYQAVVQQYNSQLERWRLVINEGRR